MYYFIVNYTGGSGKAKKTWDRVHFLLKQKNIEYKAYVTKYGGHASELAKRISELDEDDIRLVVVGGDGTINEVLNGITDFDQYQRAIMNVESWTDNEFHRA